MMRAGQGLILIVVGLLFVGVVMVTSAGLAVGSDEPLMLADVLFSRTTGFAAIAVMLMVVASRLPVDAIFRLRGLASPVPWIVVGSLVLLLLVHVPGIGHEVNGARRWIRIGPVGFQPSEIVKWGVIVVLAWHAARRAGSMDRLGVGFLVPMAFVALVCALIATEDLGTAVLIGLVSVSLLIAAGARIAHAAMLVPFAAMGFLAATIASPYRIDRLRAFLDPYQDPQGIGYHVLQSMAAISGGGLAGRGLGNGVQKFGYLPEDTTDFLFAVVAEEIGLAGSALVICLYAALFACGLSVLARVTHPFQRLLGLGILLTIGYQAAINLLVVTGLAPTKGIALPLLSSGGTGWCLTAFCIGLLVAMDREASTCPPCSSPAAAPAAI